MKRSILASFLLLSISHQGWAAEKAKGLSALKMIEAQAAENKKSYLFNEYEEIISGGLSLLIGTIGYFSTSSKVLKIAYSGVQSISIITIGTGIHDYYKPNSEESLFSLTKRISKIKKSNQAVAIADNHIRQKGEADRALRYSLMAGSGLLTLQYASNALIDSPQKDLKNIYYFLGGANLIIFAYSLLSKSDYEQYLVDNPSLKMTSLGPLFDFKDNKLAGIQASFKF